MASKKTKSVKKVAPKAKAPVKVKAAPKVRTEPVKPAGPRHPKARVVAAHGSKASLAAEVADAVGEIVNMLAGSVKRRMSGDRDLELGLPIFLHGYIQPTDKLTVVALPTRFGTIETMVLIAGQRGQISG